MATGGIVGRRRDSEEWSRACGLDLPSIVASNLGATSAGHNYGAQCIIMLGRDAVLGEFTAVDTAGTETQTGLCVSS